MAYNDKVVDVTVELGTQPIDTVGFETPMFLAIHNVFDERFKLYTEADQLVADGFAPGSPAHTFATKSFAGKFPPQIIMIGRQAYTGTVVDFTGQTNKDSKIPVALNFVTGSYVKAIILPVSGASTPASLATDLVQAITEDATLASVVSATATGGAVTIAPIGVDNVSVGRDSGNYSITNTTSETASLAIPAVASASDNWYFLSTEDHGNPSILAAAAYASTNYKLHCYSSADPLLKVEGGNSIGNQLRALQYDNSIGMYDPLADSEFPEGGIVGAMASNDPSFGDSIHLKIMEGVIAPAMDVGDRLAIWGQNVNFYRMINGVGAFWEGKCASGNYVDIVRFGHWLKFRSEESLFGYMSRRSNMGQSVKMSDEDLPNLKSVLLNNPIQPGITNRAILTGYDTVNKVFYDPVVTIPLRANIPTNDLASRTLTGVKVDLVYNTSLHFIKVRMNVLLDKTGANSGNGQTVTAGV